MHKFVIFLQIFVLAFALTGQRLFALENKVIKSGNYNVIMVCLDTLRADHVSCYGYFRRTTPNLDRLANNGVLFENAFAQSSFTLPSIASLFTSKYVHSHKADRIERRLGDEQITLAEVLKKHGYKTAAFIYNAPQLNPIYGLNQGFDTYSFDEERDRRPSFIKTLPQALRWIEAHKKDKFFVFLHSNDIHEPYHSSLENFFDPDYKGRIDGEYLSSDKFFSKNDLAALGSSDIEHIIAHYDGGIKYVDGFVGDLIKYLEENLLLDRTILIIFSDHGEILADRGLRFCHGFSVHDEEVKVLFIIVSPGLRQGLRVSSQIQLIDVMPTVLDILRIDYRYAKIEGKSFLDLLKGKTTEEDFDKYAYAECLSGESENEESINFQTMIRTRGWKLISSIWRNKNNEGIISSKTVRLHNFATVSFPGEDGFELYNLKDDLKEKNNVIDVSDKTVEEELLSRLLTFSTASER